MEEPFDFDDSEAIRFILNRLAPEMRAKISDNDVQYVLDLICDYYDKNNLFDDSDDSDAAIAEDDMHNYIWSMMRKERVSHLTEEEMQEILDGEFEYGKKIGIYTEE